jgi:hypothetical protein
MPKDALGSRIPEDDRAVGVGRNDRVGARREHAARNGLKDVHVAAPGETRRPSQNLVLHCSKLLAAKGADKRKKLQRISSNFAA